MNKDLQQGMRQLSWSLRVQVTILSLVVTTIILALFGYHRIEDEKQELLQNLRVTTEANSSWIATALEQPLYNFDITTASALCNSLLSFPDIVQVRLVTPADDLVFATVDLEQERQQQEVFLVKENITYREVQVGQLEVVASSRNVNRKLVSITRGFLWQIFILDIVLVLSILFVLSRQFIRPVKQLQAAAEKMAAGDLKRRITIRGTNELGLLSRDLETMRTTLEEKISTLQKEVEMRAAAEDELQRAISYIDNIINSMPSLIISVDSQFRITQWNRHAEVVSGLSAEQAKGMEIKKALPEITIYENEISRAIASKEVVHLNVPVKEHDKKLRCEDLTIYPLVCNRVEGAVIRIDDVTEQHQMQIELAHSRKLEAIGQLAGGIAHDFNNMLSGIVGGAELLALHCIDDPKAKRFIDMILKSGKRAGELTNQLLTFARKGTVEPSVMDVVQAIHETVTILEHSIDKGVRIHVTIESEETMIMGDMAQFQNALINLGINAGHAMPNGGDLYFNVRRVMLDEVYCRASSFDVKAGRYLDVEVRDTGTGIAPEHLAKIFEPFFTTREHGVGNGLGLAAVYGTVRQHNGAISVYSEVGSGTTFHLFLPLAEGAAVVSEKSEEEIETPVSGEGRILVIDDEEVILKTAEEMLHKLGYEVLLATNGMEGLKVYTEHGEEIDLVIVDMIMPEMNGKECFYAIKALNQEVKVILASGFSRETDLLAMRNNGLQGFLRKPYTMLELSRIVAEVMH